MKNWPGPGLLEEGAEDDEEDDVGGGDAERDAEEPLAGEDGLVEQDLVREALVAQRARQPRPAERVDDEERRTATGSAAPSVRRVASRTSTTSTRPHDHVERGSADGRWGSGW